jgi:Family of unknown function (DUF6267)
MRANEFLIEDYDPSKGRVEHPEDLIISYGSQGANRAIAAIKQMATNPETISIKPDGKPALIWGRDQNGFGIADKYMFSKGTIPRSIEQMNQIYSSRKGGGREDLMQMMSSLWSQFEQSIPDGFKGWLFGDLLYSETPQIKDNKFVFQPNTVIYSVPVDSELGKRIATSTSGIVVHTYFPQAPYQGPDGSIVSPSGRHISKLTGVNNKGPLLIITDQFAVPPKIKIPADLKSLEQFVNNNGRLLDALINPDQLRTMKISDFPDLFKKYVNTKVKARNFDNFGNDFLQWLDSQKLSEQKKANIATYLQSNTGAYKVFCQIYMGIMRVKDHIVKLLDNHPAPLEASIMGQPGQEGYLVHGKEHPIKAVDRQKFIAANFEDK